MNHSGMFLLNYASTCFTDLQVIISIVNYFFLVPFLSEIADNHLDQACQKWNLLHIFYLKISNLCVYPCFFKFMYCLMCMVLLFETWSTDNCAHFYWLVCTTLLFEIDLLSDIYGFIEVKSWFTWAFLLTH